MGLYLCVFDGDEELDGVDVGSYADYNAFRNLVTSRLEHGSSGSKYPTLILHSDCDGEWNPKQCMELAKELSSIAIVFQNTPPIEFASDWQKEVARSVGLRPQNLYESLIDVDGEPLIERLMTLCRLAQDCGQPILFQ